MIITLDSGCSTEHIASLVSALEALGGTSTEVRTQGGHYLVAMLKREFDIRLIGRRPGVRDVHRIPDAFKLVSRYWKNKPTVIDLGDDVKLGGDFFAPMFGPCSIENEQQIDETLAHLLANGVRIIRGGAFKPRSSPYSFRGLGIPGLKMLHERASSHGIKVISEVLEPSQIDAMHDHIDIYQVGTRNTQNFSLLDALGRTDKPVLIKRGMSGTLEELLQSAEYVFSNGNERIILCERGIRTYEKAYRNVLDLNAVPVLKEKSHLPVVVDPSHGIGVRAHVAPLALAAVMAGADGVLVEIHPSPEKALSDGYQTLNFSESSRLLRELGETLNLRSRLRLGI